jgi:ATP-dependent helicase/nuclease subunit B
LSGSDAPALWAVPFGTPFLPALARHLLARHPEPEALARVLVLLPSARAKRGLVEAFLAEADGRALLLPRVGAIGDVDEDEALGRFLEEEADPGPPPAMTPFARRVALARLLLETMAGGAAVADRLARDLARVLDLLTTHGIDPAALKTLVLPELSAHRERGLAVLDALSRHWPALLAERGLADPVARREALLDRLAARWKEAPPPHPVVAAGFASAPPAVARLIATIARLPLGEVLLPGLDPDVAPARWEAIGKAPTHPLHGLARLLDAMGVAPSEAGRLGPPATPRAAAVLEGFRPAGTEPSPSAGPVPGISLLEVAGPEAEALGIALAMRRALETPGRTAALVTRSRGLARRVASALGRWGITLDDSAGEPLALRPPAVLLLALLDAAVDRFRPIALLAALKHPLVRADTPDGRALWLAMVRRLDLDLRGPPPPPDLAGIATRIRAADLKAWWENEAAPVLQRLEPLFDTAPTLAGLTAILAEASGALAGDRLWAGADGRALGAWVEDIATAPDAARLPVAREEAVALLHGLLADVAVRPPWRSHPRLQILGPLEARLAHADLLILGDLNEGSWPALPSPDPWMAPAVRSALGLPPAEARIGLEAHDLLGALAASDILLTRARRDTGGLKVPSRFLLRLQAAFGDLPGDAELEAALALDGPGRTVRLPMPAPAPPAAERPRRLRVTEADMLAADPFSFYARRMLELKELDPLEQAADGAVRGTVVHRILERLVRERSAEPPALVRQELETLGADPAAMMLWTPRVLRMVAWVDAWLAEEDAAGWQRVAPEVALEGQWGGVRISGKADRIDRHADGRVRIIDYKTGPKPAAGAFRDGHLRQLPLLRLLFEVGEADGAPVVAVLEYWKLSGGEPRGERIGADWDLDRHAFERGLRDLFGRYLFGDAPFVPKLNPVFAKQYRSFDQLARIEEWL